MVLCGVGVHHGGLSSTDRHVMEDSFRNGLLQVLVATTTLAMGVSAGLRRRYTDCEAYRVP